MKKLIGFFSVIALCVVATGCSGKTVDENFISDMSKGLEERWKINENSTESTTENWNSYINAEYDFISKYKDEDFENNDLQNLANEYIESLENAKSITNLVESNYDLFWSKYTEIYNDRCIALLNINNILPIKVSDKNQSNLDGLLQNAQNVIDTRNIIKNTNFKIKTKDGIYKTYEATVENTSKLNFTYFNYNINLVDKNGIVVETTSSSTNNWNIGTKHKFEFFIDKEFEKIEIASIDYNL